MPTARPRRFLLALAVLLLSAAPARAQPDVRVVAVDTTVFTNVRFGDATNTAIRVVQVAGTQIATAYWTFRLTDGSNYLTTSTDYTHDGTTLTLSTTNGPIEVGRASNATPTAVSADSKPVLSWRTREGANVEAVTASAAAGIAGTECVILSAASTNATSCKASAGNLYGFDLINTTTTLYYLRLYNLAAAPTCSSATGFIRSIPIPPASAAGQASGTNRQFVIPVHYATGIAYCLTGGGASTDNTNAATGVYGALLTK